MMENEETSNPAALVTEYCSSPSGISHSSPDGSGELEDVLVSEHQAASFVSLQLPASSSVTASTESVGFSAETVDMPSRSNDDCDRSSQGDDVGGVIQKKGTEDSGYVLVEERQDSPTVISEPWTRDPGSAQQAASPGPLQFLASSAVTAPTEDVELCTQSMDMPSQGNDNRVEPNIADSDTPSQSDDDRGVIQKEDTEDSDYVSAEERQELQVESPNARFSEANVSAVRVRLPGHDTYHVALPLQPPTTSANDSRPLPRPPIPDVDVLTGSSILALREVSSADAHSTTCPRPSSPMKPPGLGLEPVLLAPPIPTRTPELPGSMDVPVPPTHSQSRGAQRASIVEEYNPLSRHHDPRSNATYSFLQLGEDEWRQYTHPNGSLYWTCPSHRVVTDKLPDVGTINSLRTLLAGIENSFDIEQWELYVAKKSGHFVHHRSRSMSKDTRLLDLFAQMDRASSDIEIKLELESRYWTFVQSHPNHVALPADAECDAEEAILWCHADRRLFDSSNAPFEKEAAQEMFCIFQRLSAMSRTSLKVWFIAAVMRSVVQERIASRYGTPNARDYRHLERADEVPDFPILSSPWRVAVWNVLAVMAFGYPFSFLKRIINVDRSNGISTSRWQAFLKNTCAEWTDSNLLSVVMVSGTVGMLAVAGLNWVAQFAAFYSILCALSAVLTGMLLISNHRGRIESNGRAAFLYFNYAKRMTGSPHILALILSLPPALTLWSMLWFVVCIIGYAYKPNLQTIGPKYEEVLRITSICFVSALFAVVAIVAWFFRAQRNLRTTTKRKTKPQGLLPSFLTQDAVPAQDHSTGLPSNADHTEGTEFLNRLPIPPTQDANSGTTSVVGVMYRSPSIPTLRSSSSWTTPVPTMMHHLHNMRPVVEGVMHRHLGQNFSFNTESVTGAIYRPPRTPSLPPSYYSYPPSIADEPLPPVPPISYGYSHVAQYPEMRPSSSLNPGPLSRFPPHASQIMQPGSALLSNSLATTSASAYPFLGSGTSYRPSPLGPRRSSPRLPLAPQLSTTSLPSYSIVAPAHRFPLDPTQPSSDPPRGLTPLIMGHANLGTSATSLDRPLSTANT